MAKLYLFMFKNVRIKYLYLYKFNIKNTIANNILTNNERKQRNIKLCWFIFKSRAY